MLIVLGVLLGAFAFLPLLLSLKRSKKVTQTSNLGYGGLLVLGVVFSMFILFAGVIICYFIYKDGLILFVLPAAITLFVIAISYGIYTVIMQNKTVKLRKNKNNNMKKEKK